MGILHDVDILNLTNILGVEFQIDSSKMFTQKKKG